MRKNAVQLKHSYVATVSGRKTLVSIDAVNPSGGWHATNVSTGRKIRIKTAGRLTMPITPEAPKEQTVTVENAHNADVFVIERRKNAKSEWKSTSHRIEATTANGALRKFGCRDAFKSTRIQVVKGGQTGRQYRAVKVTA